MVDSQPLKKPKTLNQPWKKGNDEVNEQKTMVVKFKSTLTGQADSEEIDLPQLDVPLSATNVQLERLINQLLSNQIKTPYAFYVDSQSDAAMIEDNEGKEAPEPVEILGSLREIVDQCNLGTEKVLAINYKPLSLFRVHPVTRCTDELPGHTEAILHVSFSPDGENVASGGGDTTVRFWDIHTKTPKHVGREHKNHVLCTAWSPDGTRFASGDKNGAIIIWDPSTGTKSLGRPLLGHKQFITSLAFEPLHKSKGNESLRLISGSKDETAKIWNVKTGRLIMTLTNHTSSVESVKWGGEGLIYTASRDKTICVWTARDDNDDHKISHPFKLCRVLKGHSHRINSLALSTDYLCRTGAFNHLGSLLNPQQSAKENIPEFKTIREAAIWRYENEKKIHMGQSGEGSIPFERLFSCSDDFTLFLWHPTTDRQPIKRLFGHQQAVTHINYSPNGRYLASASFDKKIKLWCGLTGNFITTFAGHVGSVYQVVFSPDSRLVASSSKDSTLKIWEIRDSKKAKNTLAEHYDEVYALDWSPNGKLLVSGGKDRLLRIWAE